jgi:hypothetical protein
VHGANVLAQSTATVRQRQHMQSTVSLIPNSAPRSCAYPHHLTQWQTPHTPTATCGPLIRLSSYRSAIQAALAAALVGATLAAALARPIIPRSRFVCKAPLLRHRRQRLTVFLTLLAIRGILGQRVVIGRRHHCATGATVGAALAAALGRACRRPGPRLPPPWAALAAALGRACRRPGPPNYDLQERKVTS